MNRWPGFWFGCLVLFFSPATAKPADWLLVEKTADFTAPGIVTVAYQSEVRVASENDLFMLRQITLPTDTGVRRVRSEYGYAKRGAIRRFATKTENKLLFPELSIGDRVRFGYTVFHDREAGFENVSDRLVMPAGAERCRVRYTVRFPKTASFKWMEGRGCGPVRTGFGDLFTYNNDGSGPDLPVQVSVTTWASWEVVRAAYDGLYASELAAVPAADTGGDPLLISAMIGNRIDFMADRRTGHLHRPMKPDWVLSEGRGDCKDLARLAVSVLRQSGYDAGCVLAGHNGCDLFPDPLVFTHVYAAVRFDDGEIRYLDPARNLTPVTPAEAWLFSLTVSK